LLGSDQRDELEELLPVVLEQNLTNISNPKISLNVRETPYFA
jgi:hypothetical protein